jgi:DNA-binding transcriptional regulator/RsmH inhibitor MraZ
LTDRIDRAKDAKREQLLSLREKLLTMTREIDQQLQVRTAQSAELLEQVLKEADTTAAVEKILPEVDDFFIQR